LKSYIYEVDPRAMFTDRMQQFEKFGIPLGDIEKCPGGDH